jgi:molecular chaperone DnaJ
MSKRDYYEILGANKNSSADEIKKSYRKLAMKFHPDRNPGNKEAENKFKEATEAYEVLKDDQKKAAYDAHGHQAFEQGGGGHGQGQGFDFNDMFNNFSDIFGDFGGGGGGQSRRRSAAQNGSDVRYNLEVSLEEAFGGVTEKISFTIPAVCEPCKGSGGKSGEQPVNCQTCGGAGKVRAQQGFFIVERPCTACQGSGQTIKNPCKSCSGQGRVNKEKTLSVKIPAGVEDGNRIRLSGEGEAGTRGGGLGDLYVYITIRRNEFFIRKGHDIHFEMPLKFTTAALGGAVEIPVIDGSRANLKIPAGSQSGDILRLKSKGMTIISSGGRRGNMHVKINIETPVNLSSEEKDLLQKLDQLMSDKAKNPKSDSFFKKVGDLFS